MTRSEANNLSLDLNTVIPLPEPASNGHFQSFKLVNMPEPLSLIYRARPPPLAQMSKCPTYASYHEESRNWQKQIPKVSLSHI